MGYMKQLGIKIEELADDVVEEVGDTWRLSPTIRQQLQLAIIKQVDSFVEREFISSMDALDADDQEDEAANREDRETRFAAERGVL